MLIYRTVKAKPMKAFELHFPMIQFLINMYMQPLPSALIKETDAENYF